MSSMRRSGFTLSMLIVLVGLNASCGDEGSSSPGGNGDFDGGGDAEGGDVDNNTDNGGGTDGSGTSGGGTDGSGTSGGGTDGGGTDGGGTDGGGTDGGGTDGGGTCGDGVISGAEACDSDNLGGLTCADRGYASGTLTCTSTCTIDASGCEGSAALTGDMVTYAGPDTRLNDLHRLSDGTLLVAGQTARLDWLPAGTPMSELTIDATSSSSGNIGFIMRLSPDAMEVLEVVHFPEGTVRDVFRIRSTEVPGEPTGVLYISGNRDTGNTSNDGYYIARLDGNFVDGGAVSVAWARDITCEPRRASGFQGVSAYKQIQPWDVDANGRVIFGSGAEYDFDWAQIAALDANGDQTVVEHWPVHWTGDGEFYGPASASPSPATHSGIVLKAGRRGSLRSLTQAEYDQRNADGNGRDDRPGAWPDDYYFSGPCIVGGDCAGGPGYTGYRASDKPTQRLGGIAIDRRTGAMYFGYSTQSVLPGGNPDFEPAVVAMDADGQLMWWNRLYEETNDNSTPDQYVDGVTIDTVNDRVIFLARAHGNNVINLWRGNQIAARPDASGFQNQFTGTNGNIHISWLGAFSLDEGTLEASTYVAEMSEGLSGAVQPFASDHPTLAGQPNPNAGWPDVNTTRCASDVEVDDAGRVAIICTGRRTITTLDAFQQMEPVGGGAGTWNEFVRVYSPDLSEVVYSTLLTGDWDRTSGQGGGNTHLAGVLPVAGGVFAVGHHALDSDSGELLGVPIPLTATRPTWGRDTPAGETGILGVFTFE